MNILFCTVFPFKYSISFEYSPSLFKCEHHWTSLFVSTFWTSHRLFDPVFCLSSNLLHHSVTYKKSHPEASETFWEIPSLHNHILLAPVVWFFAWVAQTSLGGEFFVFKGREFWEFFFFFFSGGSWEVVESHLPGLTSSFLCCVFVWVGKYNENIWYDFRKYLTIYPLCQQ